MTEQQVPVTSVEQASIYGDLFDPIEEETMEEETTVITEQDPRYGDLFDEGTFDTDDSNTQDTLSRSDNMTDEDYQEIVQQAYMVNPRGVDFSTFIQDMQKGDIDALVYSPMAPDFKQAVDNYTLATSIRDEQLRDSFGDIDGESFGTFIKGIGYELDLPQVLVEDVVGTMNDAELQRDQPSSEQYAWFNQSFDEVYSDSFDSVISRGSIRQAEQDTNVLDSSSDAFTESNRAVSGTPVDNMVSFIKDIKDGRTPSNFDLKDAFESSYSDIVADWELTNEKLIDSPALFTDFISQSVMATSIKVANQKEDRIEFMQSFDVVKQAFGSSIESKDVDDFTAGYAAVYDFSQPSALSMAEAFLNDEAVAIFDKHTKKVEPEIEDDGPDF